MQEVLQSETSSVGSRSTGGEPLPLSAQQKMGRSFGFNFSDVRVHQDEKASQLGARAYTQGKDVHFAPGNYDPYSRSGQELLGHELAHVVQQAEGRVRAPVQGNGASAINEDQGLEQEADQMGAKAAQGEPATSSETPAETDKSSESLEETLRRVQAGESEEQPIQRKVEVPSNTDLGDFDKHLTRSGDVYTYGTPVRESGKLDLEIFTSLFNSPRTFKLKGDDSKTVQYNLMRHMEARKGVIEFSQKKKYKFEGGREDFKMNPKYWWWDKKTGKYGFNEGVDQYEAREDVNKNPEMYRIGCEAATKITVIGGSKSPRIEGTSTDDKDWVPGEDGFIKNTGWDGSSPGLEGENIIYVGAKQFWGHFKDTIAVQPYQTWFKMVEGWNKSAKLEANRNYPSKGLKT